MLARKFYKRIAKTVSDGYSFAMVEQRVACSMDESELISSECADPALTNAHAPALDIDFPARLVPSKTEGHFHLYLDHPMEWRAYKKLLKALKRAGIIEEEYYKMSVKCGATFLMSEHVKPKLADEAEMSEVNAAIGDISRWLKTDPS